MAVVGYTLGTLTSLGQKECCLSYIVQPRTFYCGQYLVQRFDFCYGNFCLHVADRNDVTYHAPPEGVCVATKVCAVVVPFCQIHEVGGEYEAQEANVQSRYQLL